MHPNFYKPFFPPEFLLLQSEAAQFLLERADLHLKQIIDAEELLTQRCYQSLGVFIPIFLGLFGYGISVTIDNDTSNDGPLMLLAYLNSFVLFVAIIIIYYILFPKGILMIGRQPASALDKAFLQNKDERKAYVMDEIRINQIKITTNLKVYNRRMRIFKDAYSIIMSMVIADVLLSVLFLVV